MSSDHMTVRDIHLGWAVRRFGGIGPAVDCARERAILLLQDDQDSSLEWADAFIRRAETEPHKGDCGLARTWERGPVTCSVCVYDEFMLKAWQQLREEISTHAE